MRIDFGLILGISLELLILIYYANTMLHPRKNYFISIAAAVICYVILFFTATFGYAALNFIVSILITCLVLIIGYKISISSALLHSMIFIIFDFLGEASMMFLLGLTFDTSTIVGMSPEQSMLITVGGKSIYFIGMLIIKGIEKGKNDYSEKSFFVLFIVPLMTVISIWIMGGLDVDKRVFIILCAVFLFVNIITFSLNEYILSKNKKIRSLETENLHNQLELEEYRHLSINYEENKLFRHDLKEHISVLKSLMSKDNAKAVSYMQKLEDISDRTKLEQYSDNSILNILLIQKSRECKEKGIEFNIKSTNPNLKFLDDMDTVAIFSNLINNAMEACEKSENKKIFLDLSTGNGTHTVVRIENSSEKEPIVTEGVLRTRKDDNNNHGIGIRSIKNALNKYNGHISWEYDKENKIFSTIVMISVSAVNYEHKKGFR